MRRRPNLIWIVAPAMLLVLLAAALTHGTTAASGNPCGPAWRLLPARADRDHCAIAKATAIALGDQQERRAKQAELAKLSTAALPKVKPATLWPEPEGLNVVRPLDVAGVAGGPWRGANSLWLYGAVPNDNYTEWDRLYVYAKPGQNSRPELGTLVLNGRDPGQDRYFQRWICPRAIGQLTITAITLPSVASSLPSTPPHPFPDLAGVVHFTSSSAQQGTFDLASQTWTFAP